MQRGRQPRSDAVGKEGNAAACGGKPTQGGRQRYSEAVSKKGDAAACEGRLWRHSCSVGTADDAAELFWPALRVRLRLGTTEEQELGIELAEPIDGDLHLWAAVERNRTDSRIRLLLRYFEEVGCVVE